MRDLLPKDCWKCDGFEFCTYDNKEIFLANKEIYDKYGKGKMLIPNNVNPLMNH